MVIPDDLIFGSSMTLTRSSAHPKFDPTGVRPHGLQIMTVHSMSLKHLCSNHLAVSDFCMFSREKSAVQDMQSLLMILCMFPEEKSVVQDEQPLLMI